FLSFILMTLPPLRSPLFPYTTLFRSGMIAKGAHINAIGAIVPSRAEIAGDVLERCSHIVVDSVPQAQKLSRELMDFFGAADQEGDRKSTRLNSSHLGISYAVFCLKKK